MKGMKKRGAHGLIGWAWAVGALGLGAAALADGVTVNLTNDGTQDVNVTVYDTTIGPRAVVLSQRINGFTTIPLNLSQDATGRANLAWTAVSVDATDRHCGHADRTGLADAASVTVHADSSCPTEARPAAVSE